MELEILSFPTIFISFTFIFILLIFLRLRRTKLPPGPWKLPLIGSLHHLAVAGLEPHHVLTNLARKYGPIMHLQLGEISAVIISTPRLAKEVLKTHDLAFALRLKLLSPEIITYNCVDIAFAPYGGYWRQMRKICTLELLTAKNIFTYTNTVVSRAAFGNRFKNQEKVIPVINELTATAGGFDVADLYPSIKILQVISGLKSKLMKLREKSDHVLNDIIDEHKERLANKEKFKGHSGEEDLVDVLLRHKARSELEFPISINNIKAILLEIFSAGTDTSATAVEYAMTEMMRHPR
ncbi:premnaspirodiene oxygenase-like, partial [Olea europaea subsp. europaea]